MDAHIKEELTRPLRAAEGYQRSYTIRNVTIRVSYVSGGQFMNVNIRRDGELLYSHTWDQEGSAMTDFAERASSLALLAGEPTPADMAEKAMEHENIDRTYILEALINDLRGGPAVRGLGVLLKDRGVEL